MTKLCIEHAIHAIIATQTKIKLIWKPAMIPYYCDSNHSLQVTGNGARFYKLLEMKPRISAIPASFLTVLLSASLCLVVAKEQHTVRCT